jgi:hypothetical protein
VKDSKISAQEFQETQGLFTQCFQNHGMSVKYASDSVLLGSYVAVNPGAAKDGYDGKVPNKDLDPIKDSCEAKTSYSEIATLYYKMQINPQRTDLSTFSAECLVKIGFRDAGYTAEDYKKDFEILGILTEGSFGNKTTEPATGIMSINPDFGDFTSAEAKERIKALESGKTTKYGITNLDLNKCALNPKSVLNGLE